MTRLLDASPSAAERVVGVVAERAQGGVLWLVIVCCDVPLLGAAKAWGNWVHKATTTHPRLPRFWSRGKRGGRGANECTKSRQEAKVCALWQGKAKKGRQSQTKERKQANAGLSTLVSARALAHMPCTRRVVWSCAFSAVELGDKWRLVFAFESQNHDHACAALGTRRMLYVKGFIVSIAVVLVGQAQRHVAQGASIAPTEEREKCSCRLKGAWRCSSLRRRTSK